MIVLLTILSTVFIVLFLRRDKALRRYLFNSRPIIYNNNDSDVKLIMALKSMMEQDRMFTDSTLTLEKAARLLGTNRSTLSKAINTGLGVNFSTFLNSYRIKEAIRLINDSKAQSYTMESIGHMCGFNSRQAFHRAFKNETGMNLRQYCNSAN